MTSSSSYRGGTWLLLLGALVGVVVAASGMVGEASPESSVGSASEMPEGAVARVNNRFIGRGEYERAVRALRADPRGIERPEERALERLIDEELLIQRGLELDVALRDLKVRTDIASAVIQHIVSRAEAEAGEPSEAELRAFYEANPHIFRVPAQLWVRQRLYTSESEAHLAAEQLRAGRPFDALSPSDTAGVPLPQGLVPAGKLRDYIGPTATLAVLGLPEGGHTDVIRAGSSYAIVEVVQRKDGALRPFEEVEALARESYEREIGDAALRAFLTERRERAEIEVREGLEP